jgi:hypothetical protein
MGSPNGFDSAFAESRQDNQYCCTYINLGERTIWGTIPTSNNGGSGGGGGASKNNGGGGNNENSNSGNSNLVDVTQKFDQDLSRTREQMTTKAIELQAMVSNRLLREIMRMSLSVKNSVQMVSLILNRMIIHH